MIIHDICDLRAPQKELVMEPSNITYLDHEKKFSNDKDQISRNHNFSNREETFIYLWIWLETLQYTIYKNNVRNQIYQDILKLTQKILRIIVSTNKINSNLSTKVKLLIQKINEVRVNKLHGYEDVVLLYDFAKNTLNKVISVSYEQDGMSL